ncbi:hypothetical protein [Paraburkholderia bannensis]|uniref:hypothetical protein n=1 Tax=Paraburkholderia bannensis TaxID=765414 RepID=UPI002AB71DDE|nr:hypothetical protein [Paraburkholderia bannensis]
MHKILPQRELTKRPDFALPGSPLDQKQEHERRDREAQEYVQRHFRETGYLPKEYEIRRACDPVFNREEEAAGRAALAEALERLREFEAACRTRPYIKIIKELTSEQAVSWRAVWTEEAIRDSLGGTLKSVYQLPEAFKIQQDINNAKLKQPHRVARLEVRLAELHGAIQSRRLAATQDVATLIRDILDPLVTPDKTSERVSSFLRHYDVIDVNLIKKLSEFVSAKALWFSVIAPLSLKPGPKAVDGSDSPDYVGDKLVGDNLRVEGVKRSRTEVDLAPDPLVPATAKRMGDVKNAIIKGVKDKYSTYCARWLVGRQRRLVVTIDVTDAPWALDQPHLNQILAAISEIKRPIDGAEDFLEVFLVIGGRPHRIWPLTPK